MRDPDRFPTLRAYIEGLPSGLGSHPGCLAKASLFRSVVDDRPLPPEAVAALPIELQELVEHPPPVSRWIPETHSRALMLAVYDHHFPSPEAFDVWAYRRQRALFEGPLYAVAMRVFSPRILLETTPTRWRMFHRGTEVRTTEHSASGGVVCFEYPVGIYDEVSRIGLCAGLRAAVDACVGGGASVAVREASPSHAALECRWPT